MKERVVLVGGGGHAKVIIDLLEQTDEVDIAGCTTQDDGQREILGYPILGPDELLPEIFRSGVRHAFAAIGDNSARLKNMHRLNEIGFTLINAVSGGAIVSPRVRMGRGIAIMPGAVINVDTVIGDGVIVNTGATIDHDCFIGECAHIAPGANLAGRVRIGEGAFLGTGSCVIPGVSIGAWTTVGAGGVVIRDLPARVTAIGMPASVRKCKAQLKES